MSTPAYAIRRVGQEYVIVRVDTAAVLLRLGTMGVGLALLGYGTARRGLPGLFTGLVGACLAYHGYTGRDPLQRIRQWLDGPRQGDRSETPSHARPATGTDAQVPADTLDEALMETFPASDPPAVKRDSGPPA